MKKILLGMILAGVAGASAVGAITYSGMIDVSADTPHDPLVFNAIEWARERAIARQAKGIATPPDLGSEERIRLGAGNYEAMCASCHLKPGMTDSEIRQGLYPQPPALTAKAEDDEASPARRFWIIKHGIKASGMPAWSKGGMTDGDIWNLVAFLDRLPEMTPEQYQSLQDSGTGHSHGGEAMHDSEQMHQESQPHEHEHGKAHSH